MRLIELRDEGDDIVAVVQVDDEYLHLRVRRLGTSSFELNDDLERFEKRFPLQARHLCGTILSVLEGKATVPVEVGDEN
jgi:hypothetical protein